MSNCQTSVYIYSFFFFLKASRRPCSPTSSKRQCPGLMDQCEKAVEMLKTIRKGFFSTDSRKGRGYISSKYIVTGEKRRRRDFFTTGCGSCRKKRSIDSFEASCGACAPRCRRKPGQSVGSPCLRTLRHRHSQARRRWDRPCFPRS